MQNSERNIYEQSIKRWALAPIIIIVYNKNMKMLPKAITGFT